MVFLTVYLSYVASIYVIYLCFIFFPRHSQRNDPKRVWCSSDFI